MVVSWMERLSRYNCPIFRSRALVHVHLVVHLLDVVLAPAPGLVLAPLAAFVRQALVVIILATQIHIEVGAEIQGLVAVLSTHIGHPALVHPPEEVPFVPSQDGDPLATRVAGGDRGLILLDHARRSDPEVGPGLTHAHTRRTLARGVGQGPAQEVTVAGVGAGVGPGVFLVAEAEPGVEPGEAVGAGALAKARVEVVAVATAYLVTKVAMDQLIGLVTRVTRLINFSNTIRYECYGYLMACICKERYVDEGLYEIY